MLKYFRKNCILQFPCILHYFPINIIYNIIHNFQAEPENCLQLAPTFSPHPPSEHTQLLPKIPTSPIASSSKAAYPKPPETTVLTSIHQPATSDRAALASMPGATPVECPFPAGGKSPAFSPSRDTRPCGVTVAQACSPLYVKVYVTRWPRCISP